ncbi:phospholipase DDHD2 [Denticeps clupeoides]|nr:phospholipase DDHD2-like [Denticeps clupeoides]
METIAPVVYEPVRHHWFYCQDLNWLPFSKEDSAALEAAHVGSRGQKEADGAVVATEGRRYDVMVGQRRRRAVFWEEHLTAVRRCSWFYKGSKDSSFLPYAEELSSLLEESYMIAATLNEWTRNVDLPTGDTVVFHNPKLITQQPFVTLGDKCVSNLTEVRRGVENISVDVPEGEPDTVDHLVFMVHGIGPACDIRMRGVVQCVNDFRSVSLGLMDTHFKRDGGRGDGRVEFLPVNWHRVLHGESTGVDKDMERITLPSISRLRQFSNDTVLDLFFYNSPTYCQTIVDTVASELDRQYGLFRQRHPGFRGAVSVAGHSLGSLILFDILTNQKPRSDDLYNEKSESTLKNDFTPTGPDSLEDALRKSGLEDLLTVLQKEQVDLESLILCTENDLKELGIPLGPRKKILSFRENWKLSRTGTSLLCPSGQAARIKAVPSAPTAPDQETSTTSTVNYKCFDVGIGQVSVNYPQLPFEPQAFFAFGSPIGMFLTVRGLKKIDPNYSFPTCKSFYNIYHPFDPVAYRIEPMILPPDVELEAMLVPHHKGRKRMHLELKEGLTRVGSDLLGSLRSVWQAFSQTPNNMLPLEANSANGATVQQGTGALEREPQGGQDTMKQGVNVGLLNGGSRIDYVLQEKAIENFNQYLFAIQSHLCYWESEDTALLLLKEIYERQGAPVQRY